MKYSKLFFIVLFLLIIIAGCSSSVISDDQNKSETKELLIAAAASLTDVMDEVAELYEETHDVKLTFNFAGSGKLMQQIKQGAPVDVFISANENYLDLLIAEGFIKEETRENITGNKLVVIAHKDSTLTYKSFNDIDENNVQLVAIGNPESVPAGEYTETVLKKLGKWNRLENKFVLAQDVRQVLTYVETGNADIGFVYKSDTLNSEKIKVLAEPNPTMHDSIVYPGALIANSDKQKEGKEFLQFLLSNKGQEILSKYGFTK